MKSVRDACRLQPNALSDGEKPPDGRRRRRPVESDLFSLPLFGSSHGLAKP
jgi:hypothetical protein